MDPKSLIETFGTIGLFVIVFAESGLLAGFFLPGDSLLLTAGLLCAKDVLSLPVVVTGCVVAAIAGDQVGYALGRRYGPAVFHRSESRFFHYRHVERARAYFELHGAKTIVLARFLPVIRTFAPVLAGVGQMEYRRFVVFNALGGVLWGAGLTLLGFTLGEAIPEVERWLPLLILVTGAALFIPVVREAWKLRRLDPAEAEPREGSE